MNTKRPKFPGSGTYWLGAVAAVVIVQAAMARLGATPVPFALVAAPVIVHMWTRWRGPATSNRAASDRTRTGWFTVAALASIVVASFSGSPWIIGIVAVAAALHLVWRNPAMAAFIVMVSAVLVGRDLIPLAAPLVVMLARRENRLRFEIPRSLIRTAITVATAANALVLSLLFLSASAGSPGTGRSGARPVASDGALAQLTRWLGQSLGTQSDNGAPSRPIRVPEAIPEPPSPDRSSIWLWILAAIAAIAAITLAVHMWRRFRGRPGAPRPVRVARPLARLEAVGAAVGRARRPNEGAIAYSGALASLTGDQRLAGVGGLVSGEVYESASVDPTTVEGGLATLETAPPPTAPKKPLLRRIQNGETPITARGVVLGMAGVVMVAAGFWIIPPRLGDLNDQAPVELAFAQGVPAEAPSEAWTPARPAPLQIGFDASGNPFDTWPWQDQNDAWYQLLAAKKDIGVLDAPLDMIEIGDLDSLTDGLVEPLHVTAVDWFQGAELALHTDNGYPVATRLSRRDASLVDYWADGVDIPLYDSFVVISTESALPVLRQDALNNLIEPMWEGADLVHHDRGGEPRIDTTIVTQSTADQIVYGYDRDNYLVAILLHDGSMQWRRLALEGKPPPSVLQREAQLLACLTGNRTIDRTGRCESDENAE